MQQFVGAYAQHAQAFRSEAPDFDAAYAHAVQELTRDAGIFNLSPQQIEAQLVSNAMARGINPAKAMYDFAKARGYTGAKAGQAEQTVETLARGQSASRSLSQGSGGAPQGLTLEQLANMSQEEFSRVHSKNPDAIRRLMGG